MEEITMERLLHNFSEVLADLNDIVERNDIEAARKALEEIETLVTNKEFVRLDDRQNAAMDHVLHDLLSQMSGVIEYETTRTFTDNPNPEPIPEPNKDDIERMRKELEEAKRWAKRLGDELEEVKKQYGRDSQEYNDVLRQQMQNNDKIRDLEAKIKEYEDTYENPNQEEIDKILAQLKKEKEHAKRLGDELEEVKKQYGRDSQEYNDVLRQQIDTNNIIRDLEKRLKELGYRERNSNNNNNTRGNGNTRTETETGRLDLAEEARRIGDHIFKTAEIRRELSNRNISREEFLAFYEDGRRAVHAKQEEILRQIEELEDEAARVWYDQQTGENLGENLNDPNINDSRRISILERVRQNIQQIPRINEALTAAGLTAAITTTTQAEAFERFLTQYDRNVQQIINRLRSQNKDYKENLEIFDQEINKINKEIEAISFARNGFQTLEQDANEEKNLRARQINATMFGDEELEAEWDERVRRFAVDHRGRVEGAVYRYRDQNGNIVEREVDYDTINDYEEIEEDAQFLNLADYKKYLEITSMYDSAEARYGEGEGLNLLKGIMDFSEKDFEPYKQLLEQNRTQEADAWLNEYIAEKKEYVKTYHGFTNEHAVKYATWRTAGSTLKAMKPVKGDLPVPVRIGNGVHNFFRFFGIRAPQFSKVNPDGQRVATPGSAALTLATDAALVAGVTTTALVAGPVGLATWGAVYAAKGIVTIANVIRARAEYRRHKDVIDLNLPTLGHPSKDDKEVARKAYYRDQIRERKGRDINTFDKFTTWFHAKTDRLPGRGNAARRTEQAITKARIQLSDAVIDERTENARNTAIANVTKADQNQEIRQENTRKEAMSDRTYNEIVRDPDHVNVNEAMRRVARNAALRANASSDLVYRNGREDINAGSKVEIGKKYVKEDPMLKKTQDLDEIKIEGGTIANTAITEEQKYTARQQRQDRRNKIWTIILTAGARMGIEALKSGFKDQVTVTREEQYPIETKMDDTKEWVPGKTHTEPVYGTRTTKEFATDDLSKVKDSDIGLNDVYGYIGQISKGKRTLDVDAVALRIKGKDGEVIWDASIAESATKLRALGEKVPQVFAKDGNIDISHLSLTEVGEVIKATNPVQFKKYLESVGLDENTPMEKVMQKAIEEGDLFTQTKALEGWRQVSAENVIEKTEEYVKDHVTVTDPGYWKTVPGSVIKGTGKRNITETKDVFSPEKVYGSALKGAGVGAAAGLADQLHEAANQTKRVDEGTFEERNPKFYTSKIAARQAARLRQQRQQNQDREDDHIGNAANVPEGDER